MNNLNETRENAIQQAIREARETTEFFPRDKRPANDLYYDGDVADIMTTLGEALSLAGTAARDGELVHHDGSVNYLAAYLFEEQVGYLLTMEYWEDGAKMARSATERQIARCREALAVEA